jgi:hypothetical protein
MLAHRYVWSRSAALAPHRDLILDLRRLAWPDYPHVGAGGDFFAYRVRRSDTDVVREGFSRRYTAISVIGLASEAEVDRATALGSITLSDLTHRLVRDVAGVANLGDVALTVWACAASGHGDLEAAANRLRVLRADVEPYPTVEVAWALAALCVAATRGTRRLGVGSPRA